MWLLSGSLLFRGNVCKKAYVFLGSEGDNGKSKFTELIQLTLGDYAVTGNRSALSGAHDQATLDPDLVANCKSLVCTFPEVQCVENGVGAGFKFNCGKLKALTGQDEQSSLPRQEGRRDRLEPCTRTSCPWSTRTTPRRATGCGWRGLARRSQRG